MKKSIYKSIVANLCVLAIGEVIYFALFGQRMDCSQPILPFRALCMEHWNIFVILLAKYIAPIVIFIGCGIIMRMDYKRLKEYRHESKNSQ
jgi:hypothetical protein